VDGEGSEKAPESKQTEIFLGRIHYPEGYNASVQGAAIASKPNANVLKLIACPGRASVSVTVGPPGSSIRQHADCRAAA
jgi:hypothetical protein